MPNTVARCTYPTHVRSGIASEPWTQNRASERLASPAHVHQTGTPHYAGRCTWSLFLCHFEASACSARRRAGVGILRRRVARRYVAGHPNTAYPLTSPGFRLPFAPRRGTRRKSVAGHPRTQRSLNTWLICHVNLIIFHACLGFYEPPWRTPLLRKVSRLSKMEIRLQGCRVYKVSAFTLQNFPCGHCIKSVNDCKRLQRLKRLYCS
ncbi:LAFE_0F14928g1_1 [Lachancea fermentati]|uniref:LAFE_0F14928g1_1 n=1 Tax=Lachancea fermentati TaxID=4955 RepID=A0A1G4MGF9_LACFM|nr:LAFE_0F14928g1_1 [Lachancea fermentati]